MTILVLLITKKSNTRPPDNPHQTLKEKGIVGSGCFRHMTGNKAYLVDYQDFNGGPVAFGGSKGQITSKDIECLVLSPDFRLPDENQVLLRVSRQHNMYSFNLENIVPFGGLACLIAKATVDESTKWHRRFSWVFFLRTKDETSGILKDFIRQIENQLNLKVKTIRCDNGIEFKNREIIEFYWSKGIKMEYSNARTSQQNRVTERKNRTLIEAARLCWQIYFYLTLFGLKQAQKQRMEIKKLNKDTNLKTNEESVDQEDQAFLEELERLKRQEKEANDAAVERGIYTLRSIWAS
nr:ribonuclease H-like domain-containing protein [Tanacetum cinerariifolium]